MLKRILTAILAVLFFPALSLAQDAAQGDVTIRSDPQGALVTLTGEMIVSGVTPARFRQLLIGKYIVSVERPGYERYTSRAFLDPSRSMEIDVKLTPKTRFKAAVRSLVVPGWGQYYSGQRKKAFALAVLTLGSAAAYLVADNDFDDKNDEYEAVRQQYDDAGTTAERQRLWPALRTSRQDAYNAETARRITLGAIVGCWGLNLLDALIFFPDERADIRVKGFSIHPEAGFDRVGLTIVRSF